MKLDGEQVLCHRIIEHKPDLKSFEYKDSDADSIRLESGNEVVKGNQNGVLQEKVRDGEADKLSYLITNEDSWTASKFDCSISDDEKEVRDFVESRTLTSASPKTESFEDSGFFVDKNIMERELPESIVCYRESSYHVVKDICIDEGVPSQDKFLFDTSEDENRSEKVLSPVEDIHSNAEKERIDVDMAVPEALKSLTDKEKVKLYMDYPDVLKSSKEKVSKDDSSVECDSNDLMPTEAMGDTTEEMANDASTQMLSLGDLLSMPELGLELSHPKSISSSTNIIERQSLQRTSKNATSMSPSASEEYKVVDSTLFSVTEESEDSNKKAILETPAHHSAKGSDCSCQEPVMACPAPISEAEESDNSSKEIESASHALDSSSEELTDKNTEELSCNSEVETRSIFGSKSLEPTMRGREDSPRNGDSGHLRQKSSSLEDTNANPVSPQLQHGHGESSFSADGPVSGLITYSGTIAYSGSLSIRSDSSTTSTRSFAFPVLQPEWNGSPVRMKKVDRRHFRKHRTWRHVLICCRF